MTKPILKRNINKVPLFLSGRQGATAVEFAMVLWLLVLLVFGMIECSLYLFNRQVLTNACREGARAGIVSRVPRVSDAEIRNIVRNYSEQHLVTFGTSTLELPSILRSCNEHGCDLEVPARFVYELLFLPIANPIPIETVARMKLE